MKSSQTNAENLNNGTMHKYFHFLRFFLFFYATALRIGNENQVWEKFMVKIGKLREFSFLKVIFANGNRCVIS